MTRAQRNGHGAAPTPRALVIGFDARVTNATCAALAPLDCSRWPGVRIYGPDDAMLRTALEQRLVAPPRSLHAGKGNVGLALAHISAWQRVWLLRRGAAHANATEDAALADTPVLTHGSHTQCTPSNCMQCSIHAYARPYCVRAAGPHHGGRREAQ
jgi:hypothetical protein